ncbi:MAG: hypothetical protein LBF37_03425 [Rickettsiales bacterium]|jgi:hypothetical protein|nr:hypothetical protein [Rickettsiales bacterium]
MNYKQIMKFILPKKILVISRPEINLANCQPWRFNVTFDGGEQKTIFGMNKKSIQEKMQKYNRKKCEIKQVHLVLIGQEAKVSVR